MARLLFKSSNLTRFGLTHVTDPAKPSGTSPDILETTLSWNGSLMMASASRDRLPPSSVQSDRDLSESVIKEM